MAQHRVGGAAAGEHRAVEGRGVSVVAADEEPAVEADRPLDRLERARPLLGLGVANVVRAQVAPAAIRLRLSSIPMSAAC